MIRSPRAILALLTALNLLNYVDRFVVSAVSLRVQAEFGLTDAETGAVISAFMLGYFLTSPLFGWLGDRYPRKGLIAAGVMVWSVATVASGLTSTFFSMVLTRIAVGLGEASYATLGPTVIDDISTKASKNRWLAVFYVATPVGAALGFLLGGWLEHAYGWRTVFFVAGGPGVLLALFTLLIAEPERGESVREARRERAYHELARSRPYVYTVLGYVAQTFALGGFTAWAAPFLYRRLCLELHLADTYFGGITVLTGLVGTVIGGWLADRWPGEDRVAAALKICALSSVAAAPLALLAILLPSAVTFLAALGACELAVFVSVSPTNAALLGSVPAHLRATGMALSIFAIHLLGDLISPPIIGGLSDACGDAKTFCSGGAGLQVGMLLLPLTLALSGLLWWRGARAPSGEVSPRGIA